MTSKWQRNLRIIRLIRICFSLIFSIPVISLYWQDNGLSVFDIFVLQAIFSVAVLLFEIPTGYLGDLLGRKRTVIIASGIFAAGWAFYSVAHGFWGFVCAEIVLGLALAFLSGTDSSLVYESLTESNREKEYSRIEGKMFSLSNISAALASIAGGIAAAFFPVWTLMAVTSAVALVSFLSAMFITDPPRRVYSHPRGTVYGFYKILRYVFLKSKIVRAAVPLLAASSLATMLGVWLYQPLWQERSIPLWLFGILWALLFVPTSLGSHFAYKLESLLGKKGIILIMPIPTVAGYILAGFLPGFWAILPIYLVNFLRGVANPILTRYIHEETFSDKRATVISIQSFMFRIAYSATGPIVGAVALYAGLNMAFYISAGIVVAGMTICIPFFLKKLGDWNTHEQKKPENPIKDIPVDNT
ncbi:MAG: MFS transporter [Spirochaetaceae bacterium]|nr:MAG: MFS transporter [Spirochaetaceae bacterium]